MCSRVGAFLVWLPTIADQFVRILQTGENSDLTMCGIITMDAPPSVSISRNSLFMAIEDSQFLTKNLHVCTFLSKHVWTKHCIMLVNQ